MSEARGPGRDPAGEHVLRTQDDFERFCVELQTGSPDLDDLVEGLRALADSTLRSRDKGRLARSITQHLSELFHVAQVRAVASVRWPPEIAMAIRSHVAPPDDPPSSAEDWPDEGVDPREVADELDSPTVVFLGDEDEHRASIEHLTALGFACRRETSTEGLVDAFTQKIVVGLVVGSSFWSLPDPEGRSARGRLASVLQTSNLCWTKLIRDAAWSSVQEQLPELCTRLYFRAPPVTRLAVEDQSVLSKLEMRCLAEAAQDILYAERNVRYDFQPSLLQDRIIRAVTSRYLRDKYPSVHAHEAGLRVRPLANRGEQGLVALVSVVGAEVSFVVKVSPYADAADEARRFRMFASGASFEMEFFCHATLGALVFAPIDTRLADARSLEGVLARHGLEAASPEAPLRGAALVDSAIAALERFSRQALPPQVDTYCDLDPAQIRQVLRACGRLVVAGESVDVERLYRWGVQVLDRASRGAIVHGDAHPGNILFSATDSAILIDYECAGLGPPCCDLCTLWIFAFATRYLAVGDERSTVGLLTDLLGGSSFEAIAARWAEILRFAVNYELVYLARRALDVSARLMGERGLSGQDVLGIVAVLLCRELYNPQLQQLVIRCALAATQARLRPSA